MLIRKAGFRSIPRAKSRRNLMSRTESVKTLPFFLPGISINALGKREAVAYFHAMHAFSDLTEGFAGLAFSALPACPICGAGSRVAHDAVNIHPERPHKFDVRVCSNCRHGWIDPMPSQALLSHLYERSSLSVIGVGWEAEEKSQLTIPERFVVDRELEKPPADISNLGWGKGCSIENSPLAVGVAPGSSQDLGEGLCRISFLHSPMCLRIWKPISSSPWTYWSMSPTRCWCCVVCVAGRRREHACIAQCPIGNHSARDVGGSNGG